MKYEKIKRNQSKNMKSTKNRNYNRIFQILNIAECVAGLFCVIYYFMCIFAAGSGIPTIYVWPVLGILLFLKVGITWIVWRKDKKRLIAVSKGFDVLIIVFAITFLTFAIFVVNGMKEQAVPNCDYVIVLGTTVNGTEPSEILQKRIDKAYEYLLENPETKVIGTGGKGDAETISEGECIARELEGMGIASERIQYEGKSKTTVENMKFATQLMEEETKSVAVVSNGFHISRSKLILSNFTDAKVYGIAATGGGVTTLHYTLREYIVFIVDIVLGNYSL